MTTYYKGNNIGLNYDAANATWSFANEPQDFIDTNAFSSTDPTFDYTPPPTNDEEQEEDTNCPEGYIYDNTLKQCVPNPAVPNRYIPQNQPGGNQNKPAVQIAGTNRTTSDNNFIASDAEYQAMSPGELIENLKQRGFMEKDENGNLVINLERGSIGSAIVDNLFGKVSSTKLNTQRNKQQKIISLLIDKGIVNQMDAYPQGGISATDPNAGSMKTKFVIPTIQKFEAEYYNLPMPNVIVQGFGDSIYGLTSSVQKMDDYMVKKLAAFKTVANNAISNYKRGDLEYQIKEQELNDIEKEKARKAKFDADQAEIKANQEKIKMQEEIRKAEEKQKEKEEFDNLSNLKQGESYTDTSGDTYTKVTSSDRSGSSGQGFSFTPSKTNTSTKTYENKRKGGYTGSTAGRGGTVDMKTPSRSSPSTKANTARTLSRVSSSGKKRAYGL